MSLITDFPVDKKQWDVLPMPVHVIQAMEAMTDRQDQLLMRDGRLNFEWRPCVPFGDNYKDNGHIELDLDDEENIENGVEIEEMFDD